MSDNSTPASRLLIADEAELNRLAADPPIADRLQAAYERGYADGYEAGQIAEAEASRE